jgi:two-component system phosphate regulon sensor histidine kinase PhoR
MLEHVDEKIVAQLPEQIVKHIELLERMRKDFVANVSHELRTPLTVLIGYLETLLEQTNNDDSLPKVLYEKMQQQTQRMQAIIEDLLLLSHIESDKPIPMSDEAVNVAALLRTIHQHAELLIHEKAQTIKFSVAEKLTIRGNQDELHSLFSNIIFNAIKYTPKHGRVDVAWFKENNMAVFEVKDTGIGIAKEYIPRLTERFYRVDRSRSRDSGGTGLGLAIAKHVLIRHHGRLDIESEEGVGSVFRCFFPL